MKIKTLYIPAKLHSGATDTAKGSIDDVEQSLEERVVGHIDIEKKKVYCNNCEELIEQNCKLNLSVHRLLVEEDRAKDLDIEIAQLKQRLSDKEHDKVSILKMMDRIT